jgi:hypothetical protein
MQKEKTDCRIPFSTWKQGRVEVRPVQKKRSGKEAAMRLAGE